jgi:hypothetical protein
LKTKWVHRVFFTLLSVLWFSRLSWWNVYIQEEDGKEVSKVLHRYTADKLSSFGELALMWVSFTHMRFIILFCLIIREVLFKKNYLSRPLMTHVSTKVVSASCTVQEAHSCEVVNNNSQLSVFFSQIRKKFVYHSIEVQSNYSEPPHSKSSTWIRKSSALSTTLHLSVRTKLRVLPYHSNHFQNHTTWSVKTES